MSIEEMLRTRDKMYEQLGKRRELGRVSIFDLVRKFHGIRGNDKAVYTKFCELIEREKSNVR
jgi:hypothetical protein